MAHRLRAVAHGLRWWQAAYPPMESDLHHLSLAVPLATLFATALATPAAAQGFQARDLPAMSGRVAQYSLTPRGDVDGLILDDGTEVHLPPHLGAQLVRAVKPGNVVVIHGLRARAIPMVQAVEITNPATGATVTDGPGGGNPPPPAGSPQPMSADGTIRSQLHGPKGDLNGVLLTDGTIVRLPPGEAVRLEAELQPGAPLAVEGVGLQGPLGRVVAATAIGPAPGQTTPVARTPPFPPHGGPGPGRRP